jgi:hypothetical protein
MVGVHRAVGKHFLLRLFEHNRLSDLTNELVGGNHPRFLGVLVRFGDLIQRARVELAEARRG